MYTHLLRRIDRLPPAPGPARRRMVAWGLSLMVALLCMHTAQATGWYDYCLRHTGNEPRYYQYYPPTVIHIENNAEIGDVVGPWISSGSKPAWLCERFPAYAGTPVKVSVKSKLVYAAPTYFLTHEGASYRWSRLGGASPALGYIARWRATIDGVTTDWTPLTFPAGQYQPGPEVIVTKAAGEKYLIAFETQVRFVKRTNALVPGYKHGIVDPTYAWYTQQIGSGNQFSGSNTYIIPQMEAKKVTFVGGGSCTTPSVLVKLPIVSTSDFSGPGSARGTRAFELKFQNCPPGYSSIGYYLTPATNILDASQGVIALDSNATATGVGLQLTDDNGTALKFGKFHRYQLAYDPSLTKSYSVPLKAAYYQTDSTVTPGKVSTSVTVTVKYQ